jgi:YegS/Rv2252/BmrU family lipid kinase
MKVRFIINPIAGINKKVDLPALIRQHMHADHEVEVVFTEAPGHATELARQGVEMGCDFICAVGGDGFVNDTAQALIHTSTALAILPCGSGNGLARHLRIPMNLTRAIKLINKGSTRTVDTAKINDRPFFNVAGVGFDALISREFAKHKGRGFITYVKSILNHVVRYKPQEYELTMDGHTQTVMAKFIAFANSKQYGNNFLIAPHASLSDAMIDVCVIKRFRSLVRIGSALSYAAGSYYRNLAVLSTKAKRIEVRSAAGLMMHVDGEPIEVDDPVVVEVVPASLKVITA